MTQSEIYVKKKGALSFHTCVDVSTMGHSFGRETSTHLKGSPKFYS